jgi:uncharacterized protein (DUF305 family)
MKTHHLGAIRMACVVLQEGRSSEVRVLANQILTAQQHESTSWPIGMTRCREEVDQHLAFAQHPMRVHCG